MNKKVEILSPAGSYECLVAALKSGADAIYVGGNKFGARANAENFSTEDLKQAIDLVHLHGKQLYLTINTLLKEDELKSELYDYLLPLYIHGIDAVIVQDLGVLEFVKEHFPGLPIHGSTQMTITNLLGAKFLARQGVERVVTSRELSLEEVRDIAKQTNLDIESFVHGALCYSFSGQCLYSSMLGDRSGNRGQCAQPCRLPYTVDGKTNYFMSLKDICTLHEIPELIQAGVFSFKIEGRMKKPEYVASVTAMYRKYVDMYFEKGEKGFKVSREDVDQLRDIFNRGDFHEGYWKHHNGMEMITNDKPSHTGTPVIQVIQQNGRMVQGKVTRELRRRDILDISANGDNYTLGRDYKVNDTIELSLRKGVTFSKGHILYRTRNQWLIDSIHLQMERNKLQENVEATIVIMAGAKLALHLQFNDIYVSVEGEEVQCAQNTPTTREKIIQQLNKTGNTPFSFSHIEVVMDEQVFVPVQQLNQIRRQALAQLEDAIVSAYRREEIPCEKEMVEEKCLEKSQPMGIHVGVASKEQLEVVLTQEIITNIYLDCNIINRVWMNSELGNILEEIHRKGKKAYLVMPHIFRNDSIQQYHQYHETLLSEQLDGVIIRNLESFEFLKEHDYQGKILLDHHVYICNNWTEKFWRRNGITQMTHSLELTSKEMMALNQSKMELLIYGYTPNMISAQCIKKTAGKCNHKSEIIKMNDRKNKEIPVKSCCDYCYNVVYHSVPTSLLDEKNEIIKMNPNSLRVNFTIESKEETSRVLEMLDDFYYSKDSNSIELEVTKGHFRNAIK
ncbi:MAG: DUF3656 domain-containing protein [Eubacteriales bacterium]